MYRAGALLTAAATVTCSWNLAFAQQDVPPAPAQPPEAPQATPAAPSNSVPQAQNAVPDAAASEVRTEKDGVETLARGPIHESFAKPIEFNADKAVAVKKAPPEPINEIPPDAKPDGNAEWIPGYWSWDDDQSNFLWVSGTWRVIPRGQRWVAGYWTETTDGYVRVPGFWTASTSTEVTYLPEPPQTLEQGPVGEAPSQDHFWIPGSWVYQNTDYNWRPGYWARGNADWMWTPDYYTWTPSGYVYSSGYWDYPYARRGLLFPPVFFGSPIYQNPGFFYTPSLGINLGGLHMHLFASPRFNQFYFGDYYGDNYVNSGFYPWFAFNRWGGYDPFYSYYGFRYGRDDRNWDRRFRDRYDYYTANRDARPARTYPALERQLRGLDRDRRDENDLLVSLNDRDRYDRLTSRQVNRLSDDDRRQIAEHSNERVRDLRDRRRDIEKERRVTLRPTEGQERDGDGNRPVLRLPETVDGERDATRRDRDNQVRGQDEIRDRDGDRNARDQGDRQLDGDRPRQIVPDGADRTRDGRDIPRDGRDARDNVVPTPRDRDIPMDRTPRDRDVPGNRNNQGEPRNRNVTPDQVVPRDNRTLDRDDDNRPDNRGDRRPVIPNTPNAPGGRRGEYDLRNDTPIIPKGAPSGVPNNRPNMNPPQPTNPPRVRDAVPPRNNVAPPRTNVAPPRTNANPQAVPRLQGPNSVPRSGAPALRQPQRPATQNVPREARRPDRPPAAARQAVPAPRQAAPAPRQSAPKSAPPARSGRERKND